MKIPPQNPDAEQAIIGTALQSSKTLPSILSELNGAEFYKEAHREIYSAIKELSASGASVDIITVAECLQVAGKLDSIGGIAYLSGLCGGIPATKGILTHCRIVREKHIARQMIQLASEMIEDFYTGIESKIVIDQFGKSFFDIAAEKGSEAAMVHEIIPEVFKSIEKRCQSDSNISGISTGFEGIDKLLSGLNNSDLIIIAARPAMGKSALAMNIAQNIAVNGSTVLFFSLEMGRDQLVERLLSSDSGVFFNSIRNGLVNSDSWGRLTRTAGRFDKKKLIIDDTPGLSITQVRARAKMHKAKYGLGAVFVDYLQLMRGTGGNREQEIADISRGLKGLAKELNIPVVALSQLNRSLEGRSDRRPIMSDLRESGAIEQDSDIVTFIYRDEVYNKSPDNPLRGTAEFIVAKQRNGPIGTVDLYFNGSCTKFNSVIKEDK